MPSIKIKGGFRFKFYSNDHEPIHVHVEFEKKSIVVETRTLATRNNKGFKEHQVNAIKKLVKMNRALIERTWDEHFEKKNKKP